MATDVAEDVKTVTYNGEEMPLEQATELERQRLEIQLCDRTEAVSEATAAFNDQIEAAAKEMAAISEAWNTYKVIRDPAEEPLETFGNGFRSGAEWGRREALRGLYVETDALKAAEINFEDMHLETIDGEWFPMTGISIEGSIFYAFCLEDASKVKVPAERIKRMARLVLPTPSDIFGEEG